MATLSEIQTAAAGGTNLIERVKGALLLSAQAIVFEASETNNHTNRMAFAKRVFTDLNGVADDMLKAVVAHANVLDANITSEGLDGLSDADIKSYVSALINVFADGE